MIAFLLIGGIGFFMLVITWFMGELFDLGHGVADFFGGHLSVGDHTIELGHPGAADHGPSPLSSRVIFTFMTAFGGGGAIASLYGQPMLVSLGAGVAAGLILAGGVYALSAAMFRQQSSSGFDLAALVGRSARVVVSIPAHGTGQVSVGAGGGTTTLLARTTDGSAMSQDRVVRVAEVQGDVLVVEPLPAGAPSTSS